MENNADVIDIGLSPLAVRVFPWVFPLTPLVPKGAEPGCDDRTAAGAVLPKCWTGDGNRSVAHLVYLVWDAESDSLWQGNIAIESQHA